MDLATFQWLLTPSGQELLERAAALTPGDPIKAAEALRSDASAEQADEVVRRYTVQLREVAASEGPRVTRGEGTRRAYEILNECAMELARLNRHDSDSDDRVPHH